MANITSNMFSFIFLTEQLIIYGKKTKVETLSAVYTKNQNSKTVIKTIIDGGHLKWVEMPVKNQLQGMLAVFNH
jgi:hypothetical protein